MQSAIEQIQKCGFECKGLRPGEQRRLALDLMTYGVREPRTAAGSLD